MSAILSFFFFNDTATTEIYTLSLHDALPISAPNVYEVASGDVEWLFVPLEAAAKMRASFMLLGPLLSRFGRVIISNPGGEDRKSTRLNSSHANISYAVFCLKKKHIYYKYLLH